MLAEGSKLAESQQAVNAVMREILAAEIRSVQAAITQDLRTFEVSFNSDIPLMQIIGSKAGAGHRRASVNPNMVRCAVSRSATMPQTRTETENISMQLISLERHRRRNTEIGSVRKSLYKVRKIMTENEDQPEAQKENEEVAASQLFSEVRSERQRFASEKKTLEEQIKRLEAAVATTEKKPEADPEKEYLKRNLHQLQMAIDSRDRYACWVCNQQTVRAEWGKHGENKDSDDSENSQDEADDKKRSSSAMSWDDADENTQMRTQMSLMRRELKELTGEDFAEDPADAAGVRSVPSDGRRESSRSSRVSLRESLIGEAIDVDGASDASSEAVMATEISMEAAFIESESQGGDAEDDESEEHEAPPPGKRGVKTRVCTKFVSKEEVASAQRGGGVQFEESESVEHEAPPPGKRGVKTRVCTKFVSKEEVASAQRGGGVQFEESESVEHEAPPPGKRGVKTRVCTKFVTNDEVASAQRGGGVQFEDDSEEHEAPPPGKRGVKMEEVASKQRGGGVQFKSNESEEDEAPQPGKRGVKTRVCTKFVSNEEVAPVQDTGGVRFTEDDTEATPSTGKRSTKTRAGTKFVAPEEVASVQDTGGVRFVEDDDEKETTPSTGKRSTKTRAGTKFVAPEEVASVKDTGGVRFTEEDDKETTPSTGKRSTKTRAGTKFVAPEEVASLQDTGGVRYEEDDQSSKTRVGATKEVPVGKDASAVPSISLPMFDLFDVSSQNDEDSVRGEEMSVAKLKAAASAAYAAATAAIEAVNRLDARVGVLEAAAAQARDKGEAAAALAPGKGEAAAALAPGKGEAVFAPAQGKTEVRFSAVDEAVHFSAISGDDCKEDSTSGKLSPKAKVTVSVEATTPSNEDARKKALLTRASARLSHSQASKPEADPIVAEPGAAETHGPTLARTGSGDGESSISLGSPQARTSILEAARARVGSRQSTACRKSLADAVRKQVSGTSPMQDLTKRVSKALKRQASQNVEGKTAKIAAKIGEKEENTKMERKRHQQAALDVNMEQSKKTEEPWMRIRRVASAPMELTNLLVPRLQDRRSAADDKSPEQDMDRRRLIGAQKDEVLLVKTMLSLDMFADLEDDDIMKLIDAMQVFQYKDAECAVRQGDLNGSHFFVVASGEFVVLKDGELLAHLSVGHVFGESALLLFGERNATVRAVGTSTAYAVDGMTIREMLRCQYEQKHEAATRAVDDILASKTCEMLSGLNAYQLGALYDLVELETFPDGHALFTPGVPVEAIYIVLDGFLELRHPDDEQPQQIGRFSLVGDRALLIEEIQLSVVAHGDVECLVLTKELLLDLFGDKLPQVLVKNRILSLLSRHEIFSKLHEDQRNAVAGCCEVETLDADEAFHAQDNQDVRFVAVLFGEVDTYEDDLDSRMHKRASVSIQGLKPSSTVETTTPTSGKRLQRRFSATRLGSSRPRGASESTDFFGEEYLQNTKKPWGINVQATVPTQLAVWRAKDLDAILTFDDLDQALEEEDKVRVLQNVFLFRTLSKNHLSVLASKFESVLLRKGHVIFSQGDPGDDFFVVRSGFVLITRDGKKIRSTGAGDYFGERALLKDEPRSATVTVEEDADIWRMGKEMFLESMFGTTLEYMKERIDLQDTRVTFADLTLMGVVGVGGFGVVKMVRSKKDGQTRYALKCIRKKEVVEKGQQESLCNELSVLKEVDHPFIVKFVRSFANENYVYLLQELVRGGELLDALDHLGLLNFSQNRFYTACILLALEFLHSRRIAYLDLKSENALVDHQGYIKLIDFGIAQRITSARCHVLKGTPIFMAPEMIMSKGYNTAADLWSLGVCVFEFVIGYFPFGAQCTNNVAIFQEVVKGVLKFPAWYRSSEPHAEETISFVRGLLVRDPTKRLGASARGHAELREHEFFEDLSWDDLLARLLPPPFLPTVEVYAEDKANGDIAAQAAARLARGEEEFPSLDDHEEKCNREVAESGWKDADPTWDSEF
eukprot:TRINITY_DN8605_c0_g1_i2.p1 TRINITY_DN8605_c0_g1~~TRINITY_DN8605_c0_g1_i2.p1  ORF type:complete len:2011 (-),score=519.42 TRINITY_DN8605_c0_g1_i2:41-5923(-)